MWVNIKNIYIELGQALNINIIRLGFEIAVHNTIQLFFTEIKVKSSRFHFG